MHCHKMGNICNKFQNFMIKKRNKLKNHLDYYCLCLTLFTRYSNGSEPRWCTHLRWRWTIIWINDKYELHSLICSHIQAGKREEKKIILFLYSFISRFEQIYVNIHTAIHLHKCTGSAHGAIPRIYWKLFCLLCFKLITRCSGVASFKKSFYFFSFSLSYFSCISFSF